MESSLKPQGSVPIPRCVPSRALALAGRQFRICILGTNRDSREKGIDDSAGRSGSSAVSKKCRIWVSASRAIPAQTWQPTPRSRQLGVSKGSYWKSPAVTSGAMFAASGASTSSSTGVESCRGRISGMPNWCAAAAGGESRERPPGPLKTAYLSCAGHLAIRGALRAPPPRGRIGPDRLHRGTGGPIRAVRLSTGPRLDLLAAPHLQSIGKSAANRPSDTVSWPCDVRHKRHSETPANTVQASAAASCKFLKIRLNPGVMSW